MAAWLPFQRHEFYCWLVNLRLVVQWEVRLTEETLGLLSNKCLSVMDIGQGHTNLAAPRPEGSSCNELNPNRLHADKTTKEKCSLLFSDVICLKFLNRNLFFNYFLVLTLLCVSWPFLSILKKKDNMLLPRGKQWQTTPKNLPRMQRTRDIPVAWLSSGLCPDRPKGWIPIIIIIIIMLLPRWRLALSCTEDSSLLRRTGVWIWKRQKAKSATTA